VFLKIPDWVKNIGLLALLFSFCAIMIICAYNKETDKTVALAGILAAILCSNIFNIRATLERDREMLKLETERQKAFFSFSKKLSFYQRFFCSLLKAQGALGRLLSIKEGGVPEDRREDERDKMIDRIGECIRDIRETYHGGNIYFSKNMRTSFKNTTLGIRVFSGQLSVLEMVGKECKEGCPKIAPQDMLEKCRADYSDIAKEIGAMRDIIIEELSIEQFRATVAEKKLMRDHIQMFPKKQKNIGGKL
jgi:hypothetical protein